MTMHTKTKEIITVSEKLKFCDNVIRLKRDTEKNFLMLGAMLREVKEQEMWKGRWEDFDHYTREGVRMTEKTAQSLILIYEKFVMEYDISPARIAEAGGWTYIQAILPVVKDPTSAEEWLATASSANSREDLRKLVDQAKPGAVDTLTCKHKNVRKVVLCICNDCKDKWQEHE